MSSDQDNGSAPPKPRMLDRLRALFGLSGASIRDDIEVALEDTTTNADFSPQERAMLKNVLGLHELRVADIMVPRADIIAVSLDTSLAEVLATFRTAGHSRLPVHGDTLDDPRGMVHIRDFVDYIAGEAETSAMARRRKFALAKSVALAEMPGKDLAKVASFAGLDLSVPLSSTKILRQVLFVPPSMPALDLLVKMQAMRTHMALIIDEYGGTDGLASIEDIVEMIVGDIEDEHDEDESPRVVPAADGSFMADARASLEDVATATGIALHEFSDAEDVDTLGGLITTLAGRVPIRGEIIATDRDVEFEILDADPRRLKRIRIHLRPPGQEGPGVVPGDSGSSPDPVVASKTQG